MRFPANVLSGIDDTMGSTFFDLNALQVCTAASGPPLHMLAGTGGLDAQGSREV